MNSVQNISHDEVIKVGIWGNKVTSMTEKMKMFLRQTFDLKDLDVKSQEIKNNEEQSFPLTLSDTTLAPSIVERLLKIEDLHFSTDSYLRLINSIGKSYWDIIRLRNGKITHIVDAVVSPTTIDALISLIEIANNENVPIIPVGGKTNVTEALEPIKRGIAVDLLKLNQIIDFQPKNCLIKVQTGILLPDLENWLKSKNFKLGHSPQSFLYTTVAGSIAARGAGQTSSLYGPMRHLVHNLKIVTPAGVFTSRNTNVPESAAGPDLNELFIGSEGALGIITEAELKISPIVDRTFKAFLFKSFNDGLSAIREFYQAGYHPATVRLSDSEETRLFLLLGSTDTKTMLKNVSDRITNTYLKAKGFNFDTMCLMVTHYEGEPKFINAVKNGVTYYCKKYHALSLGKGPALKWYETRYDLPYLRENFLRLGIIVDTIETATLWENIFQLYTATITNFKKYCNIAMVHVSHVYSQGASLYFTFMAKEDYNWKEPLIYRIRQSTIKTFLANGGTISHHHGVGQAFKNFLPNERSDLAFGLLKEIKHFLDPNNIMNPASGLIP